MNRMQTIAFDHPVAAAMMRAEVCMVACVWTNPYNTGWLDQE